MPLSSEEVNALGQALDTTWGKSSTVKSATSSFKAKLMGPDYIEVAYTTVVTFNSPLVKHVAMQRFNEEATKLTQEYLTEIKKTYKEISGKSISLKVESSEDQVEHLTSSPHNPKRMAYFRKKSLVAIG